MIQGGNEIARTPYKWGGGHGAWADNGYDCSGSVSFALAGAGLLGQPLTSGQLMQYGDAGPGRWITIYANGTHTFMFVAGLRFDTSGRSGPPAPAGSRRCAPRPASSPAIRRASSSRYLRAVPRARKSSLMRPTARPAAPGAVGAEARGALAVGAIAVGALAVGRLAVGRLRSEGSPPGRSRSRSSW